MKSKDNIRFGIVGTGMRGEAFVQLVSQQSGGEVTCVCDTNPTRLEAFANKHFDDNAAVVKTTELSKMLSGDLIDVAIITVPDRFHKDVAISCLDAGKHIMLEKPMALSVDDCRAIISAKHRAGKILQIGFVFRFSPFFRKIKELLEAGTIGQLMSISACEYLGVSHSASYMRRWHRKHANSGSFMLAKCSHDSDLLHWLTGSYTSRVSSFGDTNFLLPEKAPATHCSKCPQAETCPYRFDGGFVYMTPADQADPSANDFDLCVFNDDKDLVDNQVSILEFANGVRATFSLQLFHPEESKRYVTFTGTDGFITGCMQDHLVKLQNNRDDQVEQFDVTPADTSGHGGSDRKLVSDMVELIRSGQNLDDSLRDGMASTVVALAIEQARSTGQVVNIDPSEYEI